MSKLTIADYAEIVTQFGYVTVWSIVWPLAPVFALINNYIELRTDALKICKHVRRPVGDRVETIGTWLQTLVSLSSGRRRQSLTTQSIISWIGAVTNATLIYLFRPSTTLSAQTPNPNIPATGSVYLHRIVSEYDVSPTVQAILPTFVPLVAIALAASHGYIVLHWIVEGLAERVLWRGSKEELEVQRLSARGSGGAKEEMKQKLKEITNREYNHDESQGGLWNGGEEGARWIGSVGKAE